MRYLAITKNWWEFFLEFFNSLESAERKITILLFLELRNRHRLIVVLKQQWAFEVIDFELFFFFLKNQWVFLFHSKFLIATFDLKLFLTDYFVFCYIKTEYLPTHIQLHLVCFNEKAEHLASWYLEIFGRGRRKLFILQHTRGWECIRWWLGWWKRTRGKWHCDIS